MPYPRLLDEPSHRDTVAPLSTRPEREETLDEQEKVLAGRHDVNMLALLVKDVQGG